MAMNLPNFPKFDPSIDSGEIVVRWNKWTDRFRNMLLALAIDDDARCKALFLHYIGEETFDIYQTLTLPTANAGETATDVAIRALTQYFSPRRNREFEIYKFRQTKQENGEDFITFVTRLRRMASTCEFADLNREIKSQVIQGCQSSRLRRKALSDPTMTLDTVIDFARATETADAQAKGIENDSLAQSTNRVTAAPNRRHQNNKGFQNKSSRSSTSRDTEDGATGKSTPM